MANPYEQVYDALWSVLEGNAAFSALVKTGNRIKLSGSKMRSRPARSSSDYPQVEIMPYSGTFNPHLTRDTCRVTRTYLIRLANDDRRIESLDAIAHAIETALRDSDNQLGLDFVTSWTAGDMFIDALSEGWAYNYTVEIKMVLSTAIFHETPDDPTGMAGLVGWWDFATARVTEAGGIISQVAARVGDALEVNNGTGPTFSELEVNGQNAATFDGTNLLQMTADPLSNSATLFVVADGDAMGTVFGRVGSGAAFPRLRVRLSDDTIACERSNDDGTTAQQYVASAAVASGWHYHQVTMLYNSAPAISTDGTVLSPTVSGGPFPHMVNLGSSVVISGTGIGASWDGAIDDGFTGKIAEVLLFNKILGPLDIADVEAYLSDKYAL